MWNPQKIIRIEEVYDTSMGTAKVMTDAGIGYLKVMGNRQGPHALASEYVGTSLARWFGLRTADFVIFNLPERLRYDLPRNNRASAGPAFLSRGLDGRTWGGSAEDLQKISNKDDISWLVVFDTWVRNCDRHPSGSSRKPNYANVFLKNTESHKRSEIIAIDHTHCFDCGRDLNTNLSNIDKVKDEGTYGCFPLFRSYLNPTVLVWCAARLKDLELNHDNLEEITKHIPSEWDVPSNAIQSLNEQILGRARFLVEKIDKGWLSDYEKPTQL